MYIKYASYFTVTLQLGNCCSNVKKLWIIGFRGSKISENRPLLIAFNCRAGKDSAMAAMRRNVHLMKPGRLLLL